MFGKVFNLDEFDKLNLYERIALFGYIDNLKEESSLELKFWSDLENLSENESVRYKNENPITLYMFDKILNMWKYKDSISRLKPVLLQRDTLAYVENPDMKCVIPPEEQLVQISDKKRYTFILERKHSGKIEKQFSKTYYFTGVTYNLTAFCISNNKASL